MSTIITVQNELLIIFKRPQANSLEIKYQALVFELMLAITSQDLFRMSSNFIAKILAIKEKELSHNAIWYSSENCLLAPLAFFCKESGMRSSPLSATMRRQGMGSQFAKA